MAAAARTTSPAPPAAVPGPPAVPVASGRGTGLGAGLPVASTATPSALGDVFRTPEATYRRMHQLRLDVPYSAAVGTSMSMTTVYSADPMSSATSLHTNASDTAPLVSAAAAATATTPSATATQTTTALGSVSAATMPAAPMPMPMPMPMLSLLDQPAVFIDVPVAEEPPLSFAGTMHSEKAAQAAQQATQTAAAASSSVSSNPFSFGSSARKKAKKPSLTSRVSGGITASGLPSSGAIPLGSVLTAPPSANALGALSSASGASGSHMPSSSSSAAHSSSHRPGPVARDASVRTSTNGFVQRIAAHQYLAQFLASRYGYTPYLLINVGRAFAWCDFQMQPRDPLTYIFFSEAIVTCHVVNPCLSNMIETLLGFNTGDVMIYSPISGKYKRYNRDGILHRSPVTSLCWVPRSESLFYVGFKDGSMVLFDKSKEDQPLTQSAGGMSAAWASAAGLDLSCPPLLATRTPATPRGSDRSAAAGLPADLTAEALTGFRIVKKPDVLPQTKFNPRAWWQVGSDPVAAVVFSPDGTHVAIASLAGRLLVVDHARLQLTAVFPAYFGGVTCAAWSPDGRYVVAGGHDDLVTIWMPRGAAGGRIVARCQGHASWVNAVQFDPWRCTDRSYRFGSVGEDARLCLWDFNSSTLHKPRSTIRRTATTLSRTASRPASRAASASGPLHAAAAERGKAVEPPTAASWLKTPATPSNRPPNPADPLNSRGQLGGSHRRSLRDSIGSIGRGLAAASAAREVSIDSLAPLAADPPPPLLVEDVVHPILPKDQVSILEPCVAQPLGNGPLCDLIFREHELVVSHRTGQITIFQRQPS